MAEVQSGDRFDVPEVVLLTVTALSTYSSWMGPCAMFPTAVQSTNPFMSILSVPTVASGAPPWTRPLPDRRLASLCRCCCMFHRTIRLCR